MAMAGQLKTKIDLLKKKIATRGSSLTPERRRQFTKRLKRLQRARRTAMVMEAKAQGRPKAAPEAKEGTTPASAGA
jgi:hypothetical protein